MTIAGFFKILAYTTVAALSAVAGLLVLLACLAGAVMALVAYMTTQKGDGRE